MDALPIELVTLIATDTFELFTILLLVPTIGLRLCAEYPQMYAKGKFISNYVNKNGSIYTYLNDKLHSFNDQPAFIRANGDKFWHKYGQIHRGGDKPAIVYVDGRRCWFWRNERHRENNLPAIEDGYKSWYIHGKLIK